MGLFHRSACVAAACARARGLRAAARRRPAPTPASRGKTRRRGSTRARPTAAGSDAGGPGTDAGTDGATSPLPYSIVVLPDTQYYSSNFPDLFDAQTAWIVAEHAAGNVAFVLHEGDIVDDDIATQWMRAYHSLHALDGVVPVRAVGRATTTTAAAAGPPTAP